jgi:photosystem II stability/assembly factor-like uncharacterized protein
MKNSTNKRSAYLLLIFFVGNLVPLMAQNDKTKGNNNLFSLPTAAVEKSKREQIDEEATERKRAAWLKAPYLTTPLGKATVGELTAAFEAWGKDHPEEASPNRRHKDDDVVKFQRKLYNWQMQNGMNDVPVGVHQRMDAFTSYDQQNPQSVTSNFTNADGNWRLLGPTNHPVDIPFTEPALSANQSMANSGIGRINCVEFSNADTMNVWVGTSAGGVWKTWNGGKTWINISMTLPIMEISDIAIDQSNSNIIYLATGDRDGQGGYYGNGAVASRLYKTTDGGANWYPVAGNFGTGRYIENLWVHPKRPWEIVVVKTNAIYKSIDGGGTWTETLTTNYISPFAAPNNIRFAAATYANLANPERIYSGYFKRYAAGVFAFQVQRSDDFGKTWRLTDSVRTAINDPKFLWNFIIMSVAPSDANCLYIASTEFDTTFSQDRFGIVCRTLDGGSTWQNRSRYPSVPNTLGWLLGDSSDIGSQGGYNLTLAVDPKDRNKVFLGGVNMWGSTDGGTTFNKTTFWVNSLGESAHADHHWGEYQPISGSYFLATDGGLYKTGNLTPGDNSRIARCGNGRNDFIELVSNIYLGDCYKFPTKWEFVGNGISNTEFYSISVSKSDPSIVMGGAQDNGVIMRRNGRWDAVVGGWDGFVSVIHPTNPNIFLTTVQFGQTWRTEDGGATYRFVSGEMESIDEGEWLTPMIMSELNPNTIIQARRKHVWRTTNGGTTWAPISNFPQGAATNRTFSIAMAQSNPNIIVASRITSNPGTALTYALYKTTDGGTTWTNIWNPAFPTGSFIYNISIHPTQPNKMWAVFSVGFVATNPNQARKVYYSENGGTTWTNITAGLPNVPVWTIAAQDNSPVGAIYAGTAVGVFYKDNTMSQFVEFQVGMPRGVMVTDLKIHSGVGKIYAGTHGRGIWAANLYDQPYEGHQALKTNRSLLLNAYPNPAKDVVRIEWDDKNQKGQVLSIVDIYGRIVHTQNDFQGRTTVNIAQYPLGMYTVQLKTGGEVLMKKFMKTE